ncbi:MAG: Gfo/Idh/MocA family oxidoreductase [Clostridia bacterium]|nr:Gfo/Idh/MocA family oxidoreductase [Clostridia bacterium]
MKKTINVAVVGKGAMGRTHSSSIAMLKYCFKDMPFEVKLHTLVTRNEETARKDADELGFENYATSYEEMLSNPEIDVVDICTPNNLHFDMVQKAVMANKHILCEKPLGISYEETEKILSLIEGKNKCYGMVFNNRHYPAIIRAKQIVKEGHLGRILSFRSCYRHSSGTDPEKNAGWKQNKDICGAGVLFDLGSHVIDLLSCVLGDKEENRITKVKSVPQIGFETRRGMNGEEWKTNAEEAIYVIATLKCGAVGTLEATKICVGANDDFTLEIFGTDGSLKFDIMQPNFLEFYDNTAVGKPVGGYKGYTRIECINRLNDVIPGSVLPGMRAPIGWLQGHVNSMYNYFMCVYEGKTPSPSFADGAYVNKIMDMCKL